MTRLGPQQLRLLKLVGTTAALVVADRRTRRLCDLADAAEAGRVRWVKRGNP